MVLCWVAHNQTFFWRLAALNKQVEIEFKIWLKTKSISQSIAQIQLSTSLLSIIKTLFLVKLCKEINQWENGKALTFESCIEKYEKCRISSRTTLSYKLTDISIQTLFRRKAPSTATEYQATGIKCEWHLRECIKRSFNSCWCLLMLIQSKRDKKKQWKTTKAEHAAVWNLIYLSEWWQQICNEKWKRNQKERDHMLCDNLCLLLSRRVIIEWQVPHMQVHVVMAILYHMPRPSSLIRFYTH